MEEYRITINGIDGFFRDHLIDSPAITYHKTLHLWPCTLSQYESSRTRYLNFFLQAKRVQRDGTKPYLFRFVTKGIAKEDFPTWNL